MAASTDAAHPARDVRVRDACVYEVAALIGVVVSNGGRLTALPFVSMVSVGADALWITVEDGASG